MTDEQILSDAVKIVARNFEREATYRKIVADLARFFAKVAAMEKVKDRNGEDPGGLSGIHNRAVNQVTKRLYDVARKGEGEQ